MTGLSTPAPWDMIASGYAETTMKVFSSYSAHALDLLGVGADDRVADIACGPGTLSIAAAQRGASVEALDFSSEMVRLLRSSAGAKGVSGIAAREGDGQDLPYADAEFDAAFSMFGLMFFPDRARGLAELARVLKPGGRVCVSSWAPVSQSSLTTALFSALRAVKPDLPPPEPDMDSLENPDVLRAELAAAGFKDVDVNPFSDEAEIASASEFWADMEKGAVPVRMMQEAMGPDAWEEGRRRAIAYLDDHVGRFPARLSMTAWIGTGRKPG